MVEAEFEAIWQQVLADEAREGRSEEDKEKGEEQLKAEYRKIAERRVRLGLVLAEIGRERGVTVTDQEVQQGMQQEAMNLARQYNMQPQQVYDMLRQNPNSANQIRAPLFEQKVVDLLFGVAEVTEKPVSKEELMKEDDLPESYGGEAPAKKEAKPAKAKTSDDAKGEKPKAEKKAKAEPKAEGEDKPKKAKAKKEG